MSECYVLYARFRVSMFVKIWHMWFIPTQVNSICEMRFLHVVALLMLK